MISFASLEFMFRFLPVFLIVYYAFPAKHRNTILLIGSIVFYAMGEPVFILLLIFLTWLNYFIGKQMRNQRCGYEIRKWHKIARRRYLTGIVCVDVAVLIAFKALGVFVSGSLLPLGISFYLFKMISYQADLYRGEIAGSPGFMDTALYFMVFPQIAQGPIMRYEEGRTYALRYYSLEGFEDGLQYFVIGLSMKVLLADRLAILWKDLQMIGYQSISTPLAWLGAVGYSLQLYFDFWGYSLMAMGLGRMMGIELPANFRRPYMARSVRDFYRRWHMTLGQWFCRYVYIPLGGSRQGELRTIFNLLVVWMLTAFWHGAGWNFFCWGGLLWICIVLERQLGRLKFVHKMKVLPHIYLWLVIPMSWMCFAITDLSQLQVYLDKMLWLVPGFSGGYEDAWKALSTYGGLLLVSGLACTPVIEKLYHKWQDKLPVKVLLAGLFWYCIWRLLLEGNNPFMYFSF